MGLNENTYVSLGIVVAVFVTLFPIVWWAASLSSKVGVLVKIGHAMRRMLKRMERKLEAHDRRLDEHEARLETLEKEEV